jgi:hypothetical protein
MSLLFLKRFHHYHDAKRRFKLINYSNTSAIAGIKFLRTTAVRKTKYLPKMGVRGNCGLS